MEKFILANYIDPKLIKLKGSACNSSYFYNNGEKLLLARKTNYSFLENGFTVTGWPFWYNYVTSEVIYKKEGEHWNPYKILSEPSPEEKLKYKCCGDEDVRVAKWGNELYLSYSYVRCKLDDINAKRNMIPIAVAKLNNDFELSDIRFVKSSNRIEKNWQPITADEYKLKYVYSYKPFTIIDANTSEIIELPHKFEEDFRGSSQLIEYEDGFLAIVHRRLDPQTSYIHHLIQFDRNLKPIKISEPFKFIGTNVEYSTFIELLDGKLIILASINDQILYEFEINQLLIKDILDHKLSDATIDRKSIHIKLFQDALENQNYLSALCESTFIKNRDYYVEAMRCSRAIADLSNGDRLYILNRILGDL